VESSAEFLSGLLSIIVINLVLSGDNAVVIGMAAHQLEPRQRRLAIAFGGAAAIVLRIVLTAVAALLLQLPVVRLVGGVLLVWIAIHLLEEEEASAEGAKVASNLRDAIVTILVADLIMSTDNVLGVAAASQGSMALLIFGLVTSMAILMFLGGVVAELIDRFWWLAYVGAAVIAWTGATLALEDPFVEERVGEISSIVEYGIAALVTLGTLAFAHWFHRVRGEKSEPSGESATP
jgi:YjbE family integral membrane protein